MDLEDEGKAPAGAPPRSILATAVGLAREHLALVVTAAAAAIYAFNRWLAARFLNHFGATPEDVGLSYATTLANLFPLLALVVVTAVVGWAIATALVSQSKVDPRAALGVLAIAALIALAASYFALSTADWLATALGLVLFVGSVSAFLIRRLPSPVEESADPGRYRWRVLCGMASLALIVVGAVSIVDETAEQIKSGYEVTGFTSRLLGAIGISAQPATISWIDDATDRQPLARPFLAPRAILLGGADGTTVFYDLRWRQLVRAPSSSILAREVIPDTSDPLAIQLEGGPECRLPRAGSQQRLRALATERLDGSRGLGQAWAVFAPGAGYVIAGEVTRSPTVDVAAWYYPDDVWADAIDPAALVPLTNAAATISAASIDAQMAGDEEMVGAVDYATKCVSVLNQVG